jgi:putative alpha-1,2-mannosidase
VIVAHNNSHNNKYLQSIRLNRRSLDQVWFRHAEIAGGGTLEVVMGDVPNTSIGSTVPEFPPASASVVPEQYVH